MSVPSEDTLSKHPTYTTVVTVAAAMVVIAGMKQVSGLAAPILLAIILMVAVYPVFTAIRGVGAPRWLGALGVLLTLLVVVLGLFGSVALSIVRMATELPQYDKRFEELTNSAIQQLEHWGITVDSLRKIVSDIDTQSLLEPITQAASTAYAFVTLMVLLLTTIIFLSMDTTHVAERVQILRRDRPSLVEALDDYCVNVRRYWVVATIFGVIVAVLDTVALYFLDVPLALTFGLLAFVTNYIPNVGFVLGVVPPALMALIVVDPITAIWVLVIYSVLNFGIQSIIQPRMTGDAVGLNATSAFLSMVFWAWVFGPLGALLAIPLTLFVVSILVGRDPRLSWITPIVVNRTG